MKRKSNRRAFRCYSDAGVRRLPTNYEKGKEISGLDKVEGSIIFHAGTALNDENW
jgi:phosphoribosylamine-glycine ligase